MISRFVPVGVLLVLLAAAMPAEARDTDESRTRADAARWDGSRWDASRWDASRWDASRWDASRWDASRWDASRWDASRWDAQAFRGSAPLYEYSWGLRAVHAPYAWSVAGAGDGSRVVCVLDSGVDHTHPDLADQMWRHPITGEVGYDFVDEDADPMDVGGHGSHVASIIAARADDGVGMTGMANAKIMAVRIIGADGSGTEQALVRGIRYCVENGAHILSMSLSLDERDDDIRAALKFARKSGVLVIASAGNDPCDDCETALSRERDVLTVTAVGPDGSRASFAPWTHKTDLAAPGVEIPGALPGGTYAKASGSSQAVPHVTGAAVLVWAADPTLTAKEVSKVLVKSAAKKTDGDGKKLAVLDLKAAIDAAVEKRRT